jgi:hypothetical protein
VQFASDGQQADNQNDFSKDSHSTFSQRQT